MAIFFDQEWFDDRLGALGKTRDQMAVAADMSPDEIDLVFDDRRAVTVSEVEAFADFLSVAPHIAAKHCGIADLGLEVQRERLNGQGPQSPDVVLSREALAGIHERLDRLERLLEMVLTGLEIRR